MWVIIEFNGNYIMGMMLREDGEFMTFASEDAAEDYAEENCAFEYKIVELD